MRRSTLLASTALLSTLLLPAAVRAQHPVRRDSARVAPARASSDDADSSRDEEDERPPRFATGITAGSLHVDGGSERAMSVMLQLQPRPWLTLSAAPGWGRADLTTDPTSGASLTSVQSGLTDIPLAAGVSHGFDGVPWGPSLYASVGTSFAFHDTSSALSVGRNAAELGIGAGFSPLARLNLDAGSSFPLTNGTGNGSLSLGASVGLGRATASLDYGREIGTPDSGAVLSQTLAGGVAFSVRGPLTLVIDAGHGLTSDAPGWSMSVGFGTAFAGLSPVSPTSPLRRLGKVFGKHASAGSGYAKKATNCHAAHTC